MSFTHNSSVDASTEVKIYCDGVFDLTHSGHYNAIRQAKMLGDRLVVGVVSDAEATAAKGAPVLSQSERSEMMRACKWVDSVIEGVPYAVTNSFLESVNCDYVAHGDDFAPCADGSDCYAEPRATGKMRIFRRTEGISTTDLVCRLMSVYAANPMGRSTRYSCLDFNIKNVTPSLGKHSPVLSSGDLSTIGASSLGNAPHALDSTPTATPPPGVAINMQEDESHVAVTQSGAAISIPAGMSTAGSQSLLMSSRRLMQFMQGCRQPQPGARIVYIDGFFDVLHVGHVRALEQARSRGDYLIVGIHDDATVTFQKGAGFPLLNMLERTLAVLALKYVDEVIIGAPWEVSEFLMKSFNIDEVCVSHVDELCGSNQLNVGPHTVDPSICPGTQRSRFDAARVAGKLVVLNEDSSSFTNSMMSRIMGNEVLAATLEKRRQKQDKHYQDVASGVQETAVEL